MKFDSYIVSETKTALSVPMPQEILPKKKTFKQKAFTLAETLITLSIIGVVAAMTVPTLMGNVTKQQNYVALKKAYNQLQNAIKMIPILEGCSSGDYDCAGMFDWENVTNIGNMDFQGDLGRKHTYLLAQQFKAQKVCIEGHEPAKDCHKGIEKGYLSGGTLRYDSAFIAQDGTIYISSGGHGFYVDVNGNKGPNEYGIDIFAFWLAAESTDSIQQGTLMPWGSKLSATYAASKGLNSINISGFEYWKDADKCTSQKLTSKGQWGNNGLFCTGRVLEEGGIKYDF